MNSVFVLSSTKKPLMPCRCARARQLLTSGKAAVYRQQPFTIILKDRADGDTQPVEVKVDPGSKTTGIAIVGHFEQQGAVCLWGANLNHLPEGLPAGNYEIRILDVARCNPLFENRQILRIPFELSDGPTQPKP